MEKMPLSQDDIATEIKQHVFGFYQPDMELKLIPEHQKIHIRNFFSNKVESIEENIEWRNLKREMEQIALPKFQILDQCTIFQPAYDFIILLQKEDSGQFSCYHTIRVLKCKFAPYFTVFVQYNVSINRPYKRRTQLWLFPPAFSFDSSQPDKGTIDMIIQILENQANTFLDYHFFDLQFEFQLETTESFGELIYPNAFQVLFHHEYLRPEQRVSWGHKWSSVLAQETD